MQLPLDAMQAWLLTGACITFDGKAEPREDGKHISSVRLRFREPVSPLVGQEAHVQTAGFDCIEAFLLAAKSAADRVARRSRCW